jgi:DTW domain-containing protein
MRSSTPADLAGRCKRCWVQERFCFCADVPQVHTRTGFLVVRHGRETWKTSNTARIALLALTRGRLLPYCVPGEPFDAAALEAPGTWLLYPGAAEPPAPGTPPPRQVVVIDGSWSQARRMVHRLPQLRGMPRLSLPPPSPGIQRLRVPPHADGMSTLEAIAEAVALLEGEAVAEPLRALHRRMVQAVWEGRGGMEASIAVLRGQGAR